MKYQVFKNQIGFGYTTAFVYDSPNNRYNYTSGVICNEVFDHIDANTEFTIVGINELPEVKRVIIDNFLCEIDDEEAKELINDSTAKIGYWDEVTHYGHDTFTTRIYMLIL